MKIKITGATLLSIFEARTLLRPSERKYRRWWWLRSPGDCQGDAAGVYSDGSVDYTGLDVDYGNVCVRPALRIEDLESSNLKIGGEFNFGKKRFRIISDNLAFCIEDIGLCAFREDWQAENANDYDASDIKKYVDAWVSFVARIPGCGNHTWNRAIPLLPYNRNSSDLHAGVFVGWRCGRCLKGN